MKEIKEAVIVSAVRTPIGKYGGMLAGLQASFKEIVAFSHTSKIGRASCRERV